LSFELPENTFLDSRVRLKGIGVSFGNAFDPVEHSGIDHNQTADNFTRLTIKVTTPPQKEEDGTTYRRPEVLIGNVGLHSTSGMSLVASNAIENLSPFGTWNIEIHPFFVWKNELQRKISDKNESARISDLKLALRFYVPGTYTIAQESSTPARVGSTVAPSKELVMASIDFGGENILLAQMREGTPRVEIPPNSQHTCSSEKRIGAARDGWKLATKLIEGTKDWN